MLKLIEIWSEGFLQVMLEGSKRNKSVFMKISKSLETAGFNKSPEQCSRKIKRLNFEYKKLRIKNVKLVKDGKSRNTLWYLTMY